MSLTVIYGPMFSGKSTELMRIARRATLGKKNVIAFKPQIDNRYANDAIVSHDRMSIPTKTVSSSSDIIVEKADLVIIDELNLFDDLIVEKVLALIDITDVVVAGLNLDFNGEPFANTSRLLPYAEYVIKLTSICSCGADANYNPLIKNTGAEGNILVGAAELYEAKCRKCMRRRNTAYDKLIKWLEAPTPKWSIKKLEGLEYSDPFAPVTAATACNFVDVGDEVYDVVINENEATFKISGWAGMFRGSVDNLTREVL